MTGIRDLPTLVTLPKNTTVPVGIARIALSSPSRQLMSLWRRDQQFPASHGDGPDTFMVTDELQRWLTAQGVKVRRI